MQLSKIAKSQPQAAYSAFVGGFKHRLTYHIRTMPNINEELKALDHLIDTIFIPAISDGHICSQDERLLLSLPAKLGGLAIPIFSEMAESEYVNSRLVTSKLSSDIQNQNTEGNIDLAQIKKFKQDVIKSRTNRRQALLTQLREGMSEETRRANDLAMMKGASSWLTTLPLKSENFVLNKREFFDALNLRYRWQPKFLPSVCSCGKSFDVDHGMSCSKGGYIHQRPDEMRDTIAQFLNQTCHDVQTEPHLEPVTGEHLPTNANNREDARLDISARSFWQRGQRAFFDVRVFNPFAPSYRNQKLSNVFNANEREKKRHYNQRVIDVEHGSFTPLVFTPYGGTGREADRFLCELALKIAEKRDIDYNIVIQWLHTKISYNLLKSAILCIRGSRSIYRQKKIETNDIEIAHTNRIIDEHKNI